MYYRFIAKSQNMDLDELEKWALRKDKGFVVRLVIFLLLGFLFGALIFSKLTDSDLSGCMARGFSAFTPAKTSN